MSTKKDEKHQPATTPSDQEPSSGPQAKGGSDDFKLLVAQFKQRTQGLYEDELEDEIERFLDKMIARNLKIVPDKLKPEAERVLRDMLAEDPTLLALRDDLRRGAKKL